MIPVERAAAPDSRGGGFYPKMQEMRAYDSTFPRTRRSSSSATRMGL